MTDEVQQQSKGGVTDEELGIAFSGPAHAADRFFVSLRQGGVRIAFCEQSSPSAHPTFRSAVMLSYPDGIALYKLLQRMLREPEALIKDADVESPKEPESRHA